MYTPYYPEESFWTRTSGIIGILALVLSAGVLTVAMWNASNNHESLEIMRKHYGARSAS